MDCENQKKNLDRCTCTYPCSRRGKCCECVTYHRRMNEIPGCFFPPEYEKTYDRTIAGFIKAWSK